LASPLLLAVDVQNIQACDLATACGGINRGRPTNAGTACIVPGAIAGGVGTALAVGFASYAAKRPVALGPAAVLEAWGAMAGGGLGYGACYAANAAYQALGF
jgi:hypothetical protein